LSPSTFTPSRDKEVTGQRKLRSWSGLARLMFATSSTVLESQGERMRDQMDLLVSLVGLLLYVAMAMALIVAVMARF